MTATIQRLADAAERLADAQERVATPWMTVPEAAVYFRCSERSVWEMLHAGCPSRKEFTGTQVHRTRVEEWLTLRDATNAVTASPARKKLITLPKQRATA